MVLVVLLIVVLGCEYGSLEVTGEWVTECFRVVSFDGSLLEGGFICAGVRFLYLEFVGGKSC